MQAVTAAYLSALTGSHQPFVRADVWYDGRLVAANLAVTGGQVDGSDDGDAIRHRLTLTVADPDGELVPRSDTAPLAPYGSRINVRAGVDLGSSVESVSLGWFRIQTSDADESWRIYDQPVDDGLSWVSGGAVVSVSAVDLAEQVKDARFITPEQPVHTSSVRTEVKRLVQDIVGVGSWTGVADKAIPGSVTYTEDRWAAVSDLADVVDAVPVMDPNGDLVFRPNATGASVWTIAAGEDGILVDAATKLTRDGVFNAVVTRGEATTDQLPVQGIRTEYAGALRWAGPFGRVPYFHSTPLVDTTAAAEADALTTLTRLVQRRSFPLVVECVCNYALQVGDTVTLGTPRGDIVGRVTEASWPLTPGPMTMTVVIPRDLLWILWGTGNR